MVNVKAAAIFLTGVAIGGAGVYWTTVGPTKKKYEAILEEEIEDVKSHYKLIREKDKFESPKAAMKKRHPKAEEKAQYLTKVAQYEMETERTVGQPSTNHSDVEERSIFDYNKITREEEEVTDDGTIRVISYEEFDGENQDYTKTTLTYYQGDDTVADEVDDIIMDVEGTIGPEGLTSFGKLDPDNPDTAYIRNDRLRTDYEVLLEERSFREVVVGE